MLPLPKINIDYSYSICYKHTLQPDKKTCVKALQCTLGGSSYLFIYILACVIAPIEANYALYQNVYENCQHIYRQIKKMLEQTTSYRVFYLARMMPKMEYINT